MFSRPLSGPMHFFMHRSIPSHEGKRANRISTIWAAISIKSSSIILGKYFQLLVWNVLSSYTINSRLRETLHRKKNIIWLFCSWFWKTVQITVPLKFVENYSKFTPVPCRTKYAWYFPFRVVFVNSELWQFLNRIRSRWASMETRKSCRPKQKISPCGS